tara:strand:- start:34758 stop:35225 length:468 start_codon:yes stop_codon:yes gene_type:complete
MKSIKNEQTERLEIRINDAADGFLNQKEIADLEKDLQAHPELLKDYYSIMDLPDFSNIYGELNEHQNRNQISVILNKIGLTKSQNPGLNFENITVLWFKKYALAASFLILAITSVFNLSQPGVADTEIALEELIYPESDVVSDDYVTYLDEWIEQ